MMMNMKLLIGILDPDLTSSSPILISAPIIPRVLIVSNGDGNKMDNYDPVDNDFAFGGSAKIILAVEVATKQYVCLKRVALTEDGMIPIEVIRECSMLSDLRHDNILRFKGLYARDGFAYIVLEHVSMDMKNHYAFRDHTYPGCVKRYLKQLLSALAYCHAHGAIHRDIKLENLLIDTGSDTIKLADFGMARAFVSNEMELSPEVVTLNYRAPELLLGSTHYNTAVDMWSVGCVFAEMHEHENPLFEGQDAISVLLAIFRKMGTPTEETWPGVELPSFLQGYELYQAQDLATLLPTMEPAGVDLLKKLLCMDPKERITASEALEDPYFSN